MTQQPVTCSLKAHIKACLGTL